MGNKNPKHDYVMNDLNLPNENSLKDLGVYISNDLSSSIQSNYVMKKSMRIASLILRSFSSRNLNLLIRAFKTYVRPILEYSTVAWNPHLLQDINALERVQRYFTKRLFVSKDLTYEDILTLTGLERLETRRLQFDLKMTYSIVRDNIIPADKIFVFNSNSNLSNNSFKLYYTRFNLDCRKFEFCNRVISAWNSLPENIVQSSNVKIFSKKLEDIQSKFVRGRK